MEPALDSVPPSADRLEPEPFALVPQPQPAPAPAPAPVAEQKARARGRPPGSRNKPKPPVIVTRESAAAMRPVVLELAPGCDVAGAVSAFARRRGLGVSVLCGRGAVSAIALRLASAPAAAGNPDNVVRLQGRLEVLTMSGTVLPSSSSSSPAAAPFVVTFAGENGRVIGGTLAGEMTAAAEGVVVVAATFKDPETHRLPAAPEADTKVEEEGDDGRVGLGRFQDERQSLLLPPLQQEQPATAPAAAAVMWHGGYGGAGGLPGQVGHYPQHAAEQMYLSGGLSDDPGTPNHPSWTHYL